MFRKADLKDLDRIEEIYNEIFSLEEAGKLATGWVRNIYPTRETAKEAVLSGEMVVETNEEEIVASGKINREQGEEYKEIPWKIIVPDEKIFVLHTLAVSPLKSGRGYGSEFVSFYENYARENGAAALRIDTNETNRAARTLYHKLGYSEAGSVLCTFQGLRSVNLICLEKLL